MSTASASQDLSEQVPATMEQWKELETAMYLDNKSLKGCQTLAPRSKVTYEQFLLFRTVISKKEPAEFDPASFGLKEKHDRATQLLKASDQFQSYVNAIKMDTFYAKDAFGLLRHSQREVLGLRKDERAVNMTFISLLQAISNTYPGCKSWWRFSRHLLTATFGHFGGKTRGFTATTKGQLQDKGTDQIVAIVDSTVEAPTLQVDIYEASQIVAWVKSYPEPKYQRIVVAQHDCEFYVTFAEYDDDWLAYLNRSLLELKSVMSMNRFGPWDLRNWQDVEEVAAIFLAIAI